jgi:hypothetical protein
MAMMPSGASMKVWFDRPLHPGPHRVEPALDHLAVSEMIAMHPLTLRAVDRSTGIVFETPHQAPPQPIANLWGG